MVAENLAFAVVHTSAKSIAATLVCFLDLSILRAEMFFEERDVFKVADFGRGAVGVGGDFDDVEAEGRGRRAQ